MSARVTRGVFPRGEESTWISFKASYTELEIPRTTAFAQLHRGDYPVPVTKVGSRWRVSRKVQASYVQAITAEIAG